jgi:hypothetical protein
MIEKTNPPSLASPFLFGDLDLLPRRAAGDPRRGGVPARSRYSSALFICVSLALVQRSYVNKCGRIKEASQ